MIKYILILKDQMFPIYLRNINHHHNEDDLLVEHKSEVELFFSITKDIDQAKRFSTQEFANAYCDNLNTMLPLGFVVTVHQFDNITSKSLSEDDVRQKAKFINTQISEPHDIMICRNCGNFKNPDKCPQQDPDHVSCPAAVPIEKDNGLHSSGMCVIVDEGSPCDTCKEPECLPARYGCRKLS